jgi:hypothetical protein
MNTEDYNDAREITAEWLIEIGFNQITETRFELEVFTKRNPFLLQTSEHLAEGTDFVEPANEDLRSREYSGWLQSLEGGI